MRKLGGTPVSAKSQYMFPVEKLKAEADVLRFAAGLEKAARRLGEAHARKRRAGEQRWRVAALLWPLIGKGN